MNEEEARELLKNAINDKMLDDDGNLIRQQPALSPREIEALHWWIENKKDEPFPR